EPKAFCRPYDGRGDSNSRSLFNSWANGQGCEKELSYFFASLIDLRYNPSTRSLAQGVFLKKVRLDLIDGLSVKHLIVIRSPSSFQPYVSTRWFRIVSSRRP